MHIHMPLRMYWPKLFFVVFQEIQCLHYDDVRYATELYLSTGLETDHVHPSTAYIFHVAFLGVLGAQTETRKGRKKEEQRQ